MLALHSMLFLGKLLFCHHRHFTLGGYFALAIHVYFGMYAEILSLMLWCRTVVDRAATFKCSDCRFKLLLAEYLHNGSEHWRGGLVCECMVECTLYSVGECTLEVQLF